MKEKIIKALLEFLILQLLKRNSLDSRQITKRINEKFGTHIKAMAVQKVITKLSGSNLIKRSAEKGHILTRRGERIRLKMKKSYSDLEKSIKRHSKS